MSVYVRKVQFKLHESYPSPVRGEICMGAHMRSHTHTHTHTVLTKPPYEISETGWGEFEVVIKVFFVDSSEKPVKIIYNEV